MKKLHFSFIISITLFLIISVGCTSTTTSTFTKGKKPIFNIDESIIQSNLNKIVKCENIEIAGFDIAVNGAKSTSILEVGILNGNNLPKDQNKLYLKAKEIAQNIQKSLKDTAEFQKYKVVFEIDESYGPISKEGMQTIEFNLKEL